MGHSLPDIAEDLGLPYETAKTYSKLGGVGVCENWGGEEWVRWRVGGWESGGIGRVGESLEVRLL